MRFWLTLAVFSAVIVSACTAQSVPQTSPIPKLDVRLSISQSTYKTGEPIQVLHSSGMPGLSRSMSGKASRSATTEKESSYCTSSIQQGVMCWKSTESGVTVMNAPKVISGSVSQRNGCSWVRASFMASQTTDSAMACSRARTL